MDWSNLIEAIRMYVWVHTPANDNWPVSDEIAQHLCKKVG